MKGLFKKISFTIILLVSLIPVLKASTGQISIYTNNSSVVVGNTFNATVTVSSGTYLGSWEYTLNYDSSKLKLISGDVYIADYGNGSIKSKSYNYTFKVIGSGSSTLSIKSSNAYDWDLGSMSLTTGSRRVTGITQAELEASYSSNNNLSSLSVEEYELAPKFEKSVTDYTVRVPSTTEKISIKGSVEDRTATASGLGEFDVSEGENKFEIKVTAQNGSVKTYNIMVNVEDLNPVEVKVGNEVLTVVKRTTSLEIPQTFHEEKVTIQNNEVPAFVSDITSYTLIALKNKEGEINLYIYNKENETFTLYREIKTASATIFPLQAIEAPLLFKPTTASLNGEEVQAFNYNGNTNYYLIYALNTETNEKGYYLYDKENNSLVKYDDTIVKDLTKRNENFLYIIIVLAGETIVVTMLLLISFTKKNKRRKKAIKKIEEAKRREHVEEHLEDKKEDESLQNEIK